VGGLPEPFCGRPGGNQRAFTLPLEGSGTVERILARFVALAYASDHPDLFTLGKDEPPDEPLSSSAVNISGTNGPSGRNYTV
jgi:hypothetical protein